MQWYDSCIIILLVTLSWPGVLQCFKFLIIFLTSLPLTGSTLVLNQVLKLHPFPDLFVIIPEIIIYVIWLKVIWLTLNCGFTYGIINKIGFVAINTD